MVFHSTATDGAAAALDDAMGANILAIHSGQSQQAKWVTIHDTAVDGTAPFDANAAGQGRLGANAAEAPGEREVRAGDGLQVLRGGRDRRHEQDRPATSRAPPPAPPGARCCASTCPRPGADSATVKAVVVGDQAHASFDNVAFLDKKTVLLTEDRGETLHQQANALDSLWSFDITKPLDQINADAKRLIAQGRDPEATGDIALKEPAPPTALTHNDGDNELTGIHVSDGSTSPSGILGSELPKQRRRLEPVADVRHRPARGEHHLRDRRHQEQEARVTV